MQNKDYRVGAIVFATEQGLGYLAKDFYNNGIIDEVFVWTHSSRKNHYDWYPNRQVDPMKFLRKIDTLLCFETPFDWGLVSMAKQMKRKTILMPMYECTNNPMPVKFDLILAPSLLDQKYYPESELVTVPVTANWKLREKAQVFVHNTGNGGLGGRNGTSEILEAMRYIESPIKLIIRTQEPSFTSNDPRVEIRHGSFDDIWSEGDVFLFPEKFNGLSLPLQEAYASGMLVMAGDRFPMNTWLPKEPLIPVKDYQKERVYVTFDSATYDPKEIARRVDTWYNSDITKYSLMGKAWGEQNSWSKLKDNYITLCRK